MDSELPKKRGRPSGPPGDALGEYLRRLRRAQGLTVRELAQRVDLPASSAAYISQLESGLKTPSSELAEKLARVLRDDRGVFFLWSQTSKRTDPGRQAHARHELARMLDDPTIAHSPHFAPPGQARVEAAKKSLFGRFRESLGLGGTQGQPSEPRAPEPEAPEPPRARWRVKQEGTPDQTTINFMRLNDSAPLSDHLSDHLEKSPAHMRRPERDPDAAGTRIPLLPEGLDPDRGDRGSFDYEQFASEWVFVEPQFLRMVRAIHPFAYRLSERGVRRIPTILRAGDVAVITRESAPNVAPNEIYAVRLEGEVVLSLLMWNRRELLLMPAEDSDDFVVLTARDEDQLRHHIVGHVATVVREARSVRRGD